MLVREAALPALSIRHWRAQVKFSTADPPPAVAPFSELVPAALVPAGRSVVITAVDISGYVTNALAEHAAMTLKFMGDQASTISFQYLCYRLSFKPWAGTATYIQGSYLMSANPGYICDDGRGLYVTLAIPPPFTAWECTFSASGIIMDTAALNPNLVRIHQT